MRPVSANGKQRFDTALRVRTYVRNKSNSLITAQEVFVIG